MPILNRFLIETNCDGAEPPRVACQECLGIEPKPGNDFRAVDAVRARFQVDESPVPKYEPVDLVRLSLSRRHFSRRPGIPHGRMWMK